jgi:hypothetical protein
MNQFDKALAEIVGKFNERLKRAKVLREAIGGRANISDQEAEDLIARQYADLRTWTPEKLIGEFVDPEEMLIRELSKKIG